MDCRRAERNLLRIRRLSSSGGFIPTSKDSVGSSHRLDYSIRTLPLTDSSSNSCGSYSSSSVASPQQQIIQRKRIHLPQNPPAGNSTGPVYANQSIASGPSNPLSNSVFFQQVPRGIPPRPVLRFDWFFLQPQVKSSSVILASNCLVLLLSVPNLLARFRKGVTTAGANGWTRQIQGRPPRPGCPAAPATTTTAKQPAQCRIFTSRQLKR